MILRRQQCGLDVKKKEKIEMDVIETIDLEQWLEQLIMMRIVLSGIFKKP